MVDSFNAPGMMPEQAPEPQEAPAKTGFLNSRTGKLVVGGAAVVVILGIAGFMVYYFFLSSTPAPVTAPVVAPAPSASATATPEATPQEPDGIPLDDTFSFRNIFAPTVKPASSTSSGSSTTSNTPPSDLESNTLYLMSITQENGEPIATFIWNGTEYRVGEGDQLGDTPWSVVSIDSDSITMLYGDTRVVISLGQGISK